MKIPQIKDEKLLAQAFTHRSFLNETREKTESNERLEFLGDSVLSFVVSQTLFKKFPQFNEGTLTNLRSLLVNTKSLAELAKELKFGEKLKLSKGEEESKGRENESLLADSLEAFIGALFLDQGVKATTEFVEEVLLYKADEMIQKKSLKDPKSLLQEYIQAQKYGSPLYKVMGEEGPAHARIFTVGVFVKDKMLATGTGKSKQVAQAEAATSALDLIATKKSIKELF